LKSLRIKTAGLTAVAAAGFATAVLVGVAVASTFTLKVDKDAKVVNAKTGAVSHENIAANSKGFAVYTLSGDSKTHPECTKAKGCFKVWPPLTVASGKKPTKAAGIMGKLSTWHRNGFTQVLLSGHPLYMFAFDKQKNVATGQDITSFGGTWHVVKADATGGGTTSTSSTMSTGTTTTTTCVPQPFYPCP
jgi:predicted lipoprotein with Yx(FWY)xxD motif